MLTLTAEFTHKAEADQAIARIRQSGNDSGSISLIHLADQPRKESYEDGISAGSTLGGIAGMFVGMSTISMPNLGDFAAAGPLAGLLTGTITGGIAGSLISMGIDEHRSREYEKDVLGGKVLFSMPVTRENAGSVSRILKDYQGYEVELHQR